MNSVSFWKSLQKNAEKMQNVSIKKLYLKDGLLAVYKPYGVPVHSGPKVKFSFIDFFPSLEQKYDLPSGSLELANRIDKNVAGVLLLTYKTEMAAYIADLQRRRQIEKEYLTVLVGNVNRVFGALEGNVVSTCKDGRNQQTVQSTKVQSNCAETEFHVLDNNKKDCMLCSFRSKSGHKHQIRVHAAELMRCPILGDHKYHDGPKGPQQLSLRMTQLLRMQGVKQRGSFKGKIRPWQRAFIPLHLFAREVTIPGLEDKSKLKIVADIPPYFQKTMDDCDLLLNRHELDDKIPDNPYAPVRESIFLSKGISPRHVKNETSL